MTARPLPSHSRPRGSRTSAGAARRRRVRGHPRRRGTAIHGGAHPRLAGQALAPSSVIAVAAARGHRRGQHRLRARTPRSASPAHTTGPVRAPAPGVLERGEAFFARHGGKTVFFGRWLPFLRITAAWLAGANHMRWPRFFAWNAPGASHGRSRSASSGTSLVRSRSGPSATRVRRPRARCVGPGRPGGLVRLPGFALEPALPAEVDELHDRRAMIRAHERRTRIATELGHVDEVLAVEPDDERGHEQDRSDRP